VEVELVGRLENEERAAKFPKIKATGLNEPERLEADDKSEALVDGSHVGASSKKAAGCTERARKLTRLMSLFQRLPSPRIVLKISPEDPAKRTQDLEVTTGRTGSRIGQ
jgi:hypothetical protein